MRLHHFFVLPEVIRGQEIILNDKNLINQIKKVLRLKIGDEVLFLDNGGKEYRMVIEQLDNLVIRGKVIEVSENKNEPELKITLYQALCKKDKFEWLLQKGTEVGISAFAPIITERTEKLGLNRERAEKILKEAAEQSERGTIPKLLEIQKFNEVIPIRQPAERNLTVLLDRSGEPIKSYLSSVNGQLSNVNLFVGPEGGWTAEELKAASDKGIVIISLGPRVLRTETAGLVAAAILLNK